MKLSLLFSFVIFLAFAACAQDRTKKAIRGEGEVVKQEIELETLSGVKLGFHGDIILTPGSSQKIVLEGQQNILDNIKRTVKNGVWKVYNERNVRNAKPVKIYITMSELKVAEVSGSGSITSDGHFSGGHDLAVGVSGSGDIDLDIDAGQIDLSVSGSGEVTLAGTGKTMDISISGSGDVHAADLRVGDCDITISGSGDVEVRVTGALTSQVSGSGDIRYAGNPSKVRSSISGSGDVVEIN